MPEYSPQTARTLLHPYEAAQQARTVGPQRTEDAVLPSTSDETMVTNTSNHCSSFKLKPSLPSQSHRESARNHG
jgi:hypothetical protein